MFELVRRFAARLRHRRFERELAEELSHHRALKAEELARTGPGQADGVSPSAARAAVARAMGNELRMRELSREVWIPADLDALRQDLRDAWRMARRRPLPALASVAALALGLGATLVAFALLNALLLRPLPVSRPERLAYLDAPTFSYPIAQAVRERAAFFEHTFAWTLTQHDTVWTGDAEPTLVMLASGSVHDALALRPALGRLLVPGDEGTSPASARAVAVISHDAWRRRFGGREDVVGRILRIGPTAVTIVGVTPEGFFGVAPGRAPEVTMPVTLTPRLRPQDGDVLAQPARAWLHIMGRLRDDITFEQARVRFEAIWPQVLAAVADSALSPERRARFLSRPAALADGRVGFSPVRAQFRTPLLIVLALAGLQLLVGCATGANLLLASAWGRSRELAVRLALGCGRARAARQLLVEGLGIALAAAVIALALCRPASTAIVAQLSTTSRPVTLDPVLDARVVGFALGAALLAGVILSAPAMLLAARIRPGVGLQSGSRVISAESGRLGRLLVAVQAALAVVLLVGASLFVRSLAHVVGSDPGFDPDRVLVVRVDSSAIAAAALDRTAAQADAAALHDALVESLARTPGVIDGSVSVYPPISDEDGAWTNSMAVDGALVSEQARAVYFNAVSPRYFATLGTRLVAGRDFRRADAAGGERVVIVNESLAARAFGGQPPLGRRLSLGRDPVRHDLTIVGVVRDARYQRLQETPRDIAYLPYLQAHGAAPSGSLFASVRVAAASSRARADVLAAVRAADPRLLPRAEWLTDRIHESLVNERLLAGIALALGACAGLLFAVALFALLAHVVARRTQEMGVRLALGARPRDLLGSVMFEAATLTLAGAAAGCLLAMVGGPHVRSMLHGVAPVDPEGYLAVVMLALGISLLAGAVPAIRAASVDPSVALRGE